MHVADGAVDWVLDHLPAGSGEESGSAQLWLVTTVD